MYIVRKMWQSNALKYTAAKVFTPLQILTLSKVPNDLFSSD